MVQHANILALAAALALSAGCAPTAPAGAPKAELSNTYWKLAELDGKKIVMDPAQQREVRITLADGRVSGFSGCNQIMGGYTLEGAALRFTQMAGTRMACPAPLMELESSVLGSLGRVTGYRIEGQQLLLLKDAATVARYEAVYLK